MVYGIALGAQLGVTAIYLRGIYSHFPKRTLVLQGSAIAVSALIQTYRPYTQGALARHMHRNTAFLLLIFQPFLLISALGSLAEVGWKINLAATLFFSFFQLEVSRQVSFRASVNPTIEKAEKLLEQFKKELSEKKIDTSYRTLKQIIEIRKQTPFLCATLELKGLYTDGVLHFCENLPEDKGAATTWYQKIDPTIYRPISRAWNRVYAALIEAGSRLGIKKNWLKEMPPLKKNSGCYFRALCLTFDSTYKDAIRMKFEDIWEENYYFYLFNVEGPGKADEYFENSLKYIGHYETCHLQEEALQLGENLIVFHLLVKDLKVLLKYETFCCFLEIRSELFQKLKQKPNFFDSIRQKISEEDQEIFKKIEDYVKSI